jgi:hypothetical protein
MKVLTIIMKTIFIGFGLVVLFVFVSCIIDMYFPNFILNNLGK